MKNFKRLKIWQKGVEIALGSSSKVETQAIIIENLNLVKLRKN